MPTTICQSCATGDPEIGPRNSNGKWRALVGWTHNNDTEEGIKEGKIWCWVSEHPEKFQIFDQNFNRGGKGEVRDCGVANFTMIRMFHPYWCWRSPPTGLTMQPPEDGEIDDKKRCRKRYKGLIREHRRQLDLPVESEDGGDSQPDKKITSPKKAAKQKRAASRKKKGVHKKNASRPTDLAPEEVVPGGAAADPMILESAVSPVEDETMNGHSIHQGQINKLSVSDLYHRTSSRRDKTSVKRRGQHLNESPEACTSSDRNADKACERRSMSRLPGMLRQGELQRLFPKDTAVTKFAGRESVKQVVTVEDVTESLFVPEDQPAGSNDDTKIKIESVETSSGQTREDSNFTELIMDMEGCERNPIEIDW